jgi:hypothetical protein
MVEYNVQKSREAQAKHCNEKGHPHFAPASGICWSCGKNIYSPIEHPRKNMQTGEVIGTYTTGITVEKAATEVVTRCPHCNRSYCD